MQIYAPLFLILSRATAARTCFYCACELAVYGPTDAFATSRRDSCETSSSLKMSQHKGVKRTPPPPLVQSLFCL